MKNGRPFGVDIYIYIYIYEWGSMEDKIKWRLGVPS